MRIRRLSLTFVSLWTATDSMVIRFCNPFSMFLPLFSSCLFHLVLRIHVFACSINFNLVALREKMGTK